MILLSSYIKKYDDKSWVTFFSVKDTIMHMGRAFQLSAVLVAVATASGCAGLDSYDSGPNYRNVSEMKVELPFENTIPDRYSKYGRDVSPRVKFGDVPEGTESIALIMDDPDAPGQTWVHWVVWNIPVNSSLPEGLPEDPELENGARQGENDFGDIGYGGPKPPSGTHTYRFKVYALETVLDLQAGASKRELESAMEGHLLAQGMAEADYTR